MIRCGQNHSSGREADGNEGWGVEDEGVSSTRRTVKTSSEFRERDVSLSQEARRNGSQEHYRGSRVSGAIYSRGCILKGWERASPVAPR